MTQLIFQQLDAWIQANSEDLTMDKFYNKIEHYMKISMLTRIAKRQLNIIIMQHAQQILPLYIQAITAGQHSKWQENRKIETHTEIFYFNLTASFKIY